MVIMIIVLVALIVLLFAASMYMRGECKQYDDTKLSDVPAKCINSRGGTY